MRRLLLDTAAIAIAGRHRPGRLAGRLGGLELGTALNVLIAAALVAAVGAVLWLKRRSKADCQNPGSSTPAACTLPPGGCGCGPKAAS